MFFDSNTPASVIVMIYLIRADRALSLEILVLIHCYRYMNKWSFKRLLFQFIRALLRHAPRIKPLDEEEMHIFYYGFGLTEI